MIWALIITLIMGIGRPEMTTAILHPTNLSDINLIPSGDPKIEDYVIDLGSLSLKEGEREEVAYSEGANLDGGDAVASHGPLVPLEFDVVVHGCGATAEAGRQNLMGNIHALVQAARAGGTFEYKPEDLGGTVRSTFYHYVQSQPPRQRAVRGNNLDAPPVVEESGGTSYVFASILEMVLMTQPFATSDPDVPIVMVNNVTVYNQDDGVAGYVTTAADAVKGTIEAVTQLRIRNMVSAAIGRLWYFLRSSGLTNFAPILEGGTADDNSEVWWSTVADTSRRSNSFLRYAPPEEANDQWAYRSFTISNPDDHTGRAAIAVICRSWDETIAAWDLKASVEVANTEMETEGKNPEKAGAWHVVILGEVDIPPTPISADESFSPVITLYLRRTSGAAAIDVDFLMLLYVNEYPQQVTMDDGVGVASGCSFMLENFQEELCHVVNASTLAFVKTAEAVAPLLQLKPDIEQRLYFLWQRQDGLAEDDFEDYEAWRWKKVADFETDEGWSGSGDSADTIHYVEGSQGRKLTSSVSVDRSSRLTYAAPQDFTGEGRFTDDDYVYIALYLTNVSSSFGVQIRFETDTLLRDYYYKNWLSTGLSSGWSFLKIEKTDFDVNGSPTWESIEAIAIILSTASISTEATFDDWRIVRADPDDATKGNDTGSVWDFIRDVWHIEELDSATKTLGCIDNTEGLEQVALIHEEPSANIKLLAKVRAKRDNGKVGLVFRCEDGTSGSEDMAALTIGTTLDQLELRRWTGGSISNLATAVSQVTAPDTDYWLGVQVIGDTVRCYFGEEIADIWNEDTEEFVADAKVFDVTDAVFASGGALAGGQAGLISMGALGRFDDVELYSIGEHVPGDSIEIYLPVIFRSVYPFGE